MFHLDLVSGLHVRQLPRPCLSADGPADLYSLCFGSIAYASLLLDFSDQTWHALCSAIIGVLITGFFGSDLFLMFISASPSPESACYLAVRTSDVHKSVCLSYCSGSSYILLVFLVWQLFGRAYYFTCSACIVKRNFALIRFSYLLLQTNSQCFLQGSRNFVHKVVF